MAYRFTCSDENFNPATGECSAGEWTEDSGLLPPLSAADAIQISAAIVACWFVGFIIRQIRKLAESELNRQ